MTLKQSIDPSVLCALHQAIVTSVMFPAGPVVLPHALRILERDMGSPVEKVRMSAIRSGREIEVIVHARLPAQRPPIQGRPVVTEDGLGSGDEMNDEGEEDLMGDEAMPEEVDAASEVKMENTIPQPQVGERSTSEQDKVEEPLPLGQAAQPLPTLPSFVSGSNRPEPTVSTSSVTPKSLAVKGSSTATDLPKREPKKVDVFSTGAWKGTTTKDDESDEEMPEIDMGFDTDEE